MTLTTIPIPGPVGTPVPLSTFGIPVASNINELIIDLTPILNPWNTYTPLWTSDATQPTIGAGTLLGKYIQLGKVGFASITMILDPLGSSFIGTGFYKWSLPAGWISAGNTSGLTVVGMARVFDSSSTISYVGAVNVAAVSTTVNVGIHGASQGVGAVNSTVTPAFTFASGDQVIIEIKMELS